MLYNNLVKLCAFGGTTLKIAIDAFGGDYAPLEIVKGAITSVNLIDDVKIVLIGDEVKIKEILNDYGYTGDKIEVMNATEVITNEESPTAAIRTKKNSSIVVGLKRLKEDDEVVGFISAGSTGAVLAGATFIVGRMENVLRPALSPCLPTALGTETLLIDSGANVDCKSEYLVQFAHMGSEYLRCKNGLENPRVGLLNIGAEDKKGNALTHEAFELLKKEEGINFIGNVEARELISGNVDVVVADGFAGNVALKATEGAVLNLLKVIKTEIKDASPFAKLGAGMMKSVFKKVKGRFDYNKLGGSVFIGVNKIVLKTHGTSKAETILTCVRQVKELHDSHFIEKLRANFELKGE